MKKRILFCLSFSALLLLSSCRQPTADWLGEPFPDKQKAVAQTVQDIFQAARDKDTGRLEAFHLAGPKFTKFDDGDQRDRMNAEQGNKAEKELFTAIDDFTFNLLDLKTDVFDHMAIATFMMDYKAKLQGAPISGKVRGTLVFVEQAGQWKIVHEHFSTY